MYMYLLKSQLLVVPVSLNQYRYTRTTGVALKLLLPHRSTEYVR